ncbi:ROK family protein [Companilactobacillus sp. HBUAS56275]|uniref:ROK family protein n=1 Tax=Candidatus Companilactobacillus pullicola TaxID=2838523 RepID=A0A9D1ZLK5_9LACO|nr:ROK family protein [Candidatus Companilactobacillus pullicola]
MNKYLSIDIGGTNVKYALLDHNGNLIKKNKIKTENTKDKFLDKLDTLIYSNTGEIKGIAICAPGKIEKNEIHFGGSLPFLDGLNFVQRYKNLNLPIATINDGKASVLAENWLGSLKNISNCASITLGTGVGGGIIINGKLLNGVHYQAGELSFIQMDVHDMSLNGMAGGYSSAVKMIEQINRAINNPDIKDGKTAFEAIIKGDVKAKQIYEEFCKRIAYLILTIQAVDDLKRIAIGGGISAQPCVIQGINKAYDDMLNTNELLKQTLTRPEIVEAKFKNDANIFGALNNLLIHINKNNN